MMDSLDLIETLEQLIDGMRDAGVMLIRDRDHPHYEELADHAEELYGAAAVIEGWIAGLTDRMRNSTASISR